MAVRERWQKSMAYPNTRTVYVLLTDGTVYRETGTDTVMNYAVRYAIDPQGEEQVVQAYAVNQDGKISNVRYPNEPVDEEQLLWMKLRSVPYDHKL